MGFNRHFQANGASRPHRMFVTWWYKSALYDHRALWPFGRRRHRPIAEVWTHQALYSLLLIESLLCWPVWFSFRFIF